MSTLIPMRRLVALAVAGAAVLLAPSSALAAHDLLVYKLDAQVSLDQDDADVSLTCKSSGDYAVDGMWRIDSVDQADPPQINKDLVSTDVDKAQLNATGDGYDFHFNKNADGDEQLKVFITCLRPNTDAPPGGHSHSLSFDNSGAGYAGGRYTKTVTNGLTAGNKTVAGTCPAGSVLVSPGYALGTANSSEYQSIPDTSSAAKKLTDRIWGFALDPSETATVTYRCLKAKVDPFTLGSGKVEKHRLVVKWQADATSSIAPAVIDNGKYDEVRATCGDHYKGLVSGWSQGDTAPGDNLAKLHYLGQDPRLKQRAFKFLADESGHTVRTGVLCFNDRTT